MLHLTLVWIRGYFRAQKSAQLSEAEVVETQLDFRIKPRPHAIYPYLLGNFYVLFPAWYLIVRANYSDFRLAVETFSRLMHESFAIFQLNATKMAGRSYAIHPVLNVLQGIDGETNCYPSLHVSMTCLSYHLVLRLASDAPQMTKEAHRRICIDVCRSTLETKQHSLICVIGGVEIARRILSEHWDVSWDDQLLRDAVPEISETEHKMIAEIAQSSESILSLLPKLIQYFSMRGAA